MNCPDCNEPILSRRLGHCPSCRVVLPDAIKLSDSDSARLEKEFEQAKKALRKARLPEFDDDGLGLLGSGPDGSVGDVD